MYFACRDMLSEAFGLHVISLGSRDQVAANCDCDISLFLHPGVSKDFAGMTASNLNVCSTLHWYVSLQAENAYFADIHLVRHAVSHEICSRQLNLQRNTY